MGGAHGTPLALGIQAHCGGDGDSAIWIRQMAIDCLFGSGLQPPAGINSPVLAAHTCSQSRAGAGMMAQSLCPILISGKADGGVSLDDAGLLLAACCRGALTWVSAQQVAVSGRTEHSMQIYHLYAGLKLHKYQVIPRGLVYRKGCACCSSKRSGGLWSNPIGCWSVCLPPSRTQNMGVILPAWVTAQLRA